MLADGTIKHASREDVEADIVIRNAAASIPELMEDIPLALAGYSQPQIAVDHGE